MMTDQVFAQALLLAGDLDARQQEVLHSLCASCVRSLEAQLKEGITAEDCEECFVAAAGFHALAALEHFGTGVEEFKAGDLTVKTGSGSRRDLARQAMILMRPYLRDPFLFVGV